MLVVCHDLPSDCVAIAAFESTDNVDKVSVLDFRWFQTTKDVLRGPGKGGDTTHLGFAYTADGYSTDNTARLYEVSTYHNVRTSSYTDVRFSGPRFVSDVAIDYVALFCHHRCRAGPSLLHSQSQRLPRPTTDRCLHCDIVVLL